MTARAIRTRASLDAAISVLARGHRRPRAIAVSRELLGELRTVLHVPEDQPVLYRGQKIVVREAGAARHFTFADAASRKD